MKLFRARYDNLLSNIGLDVSWCKISWSYTNKNKIPNDKGSESELPSQQKVDTSFHSYVANACKGWYYIGIVVSLATMVLSFALLSYVLVTSLTKPRHAYGDNAKDQIIQPLIPGTPSFPWSHLFYLITSMLISAGFHELGHGLAAWSWGLVVEEFGIFLFFVVPGAYVKLDEVKFVRSKPSTKLAVTCAGVWHNVLLVFLAWLLISLAPHLLSAAYERDTGVVISSVDRKSQLYGPKGLLPGAVVSNVNGCPVLDKNTWYSCLRSVTAEPVIGYCLNPYRTKQPSHHHDCCRTFRDPSAPPWSSSHGMDRGAFGGQEGATDPMGNSNLCYGYDSYHHNKLDRSQGRISGSLTPKYVCLPARWVADRFPFCKNVRDCYAYDAGIVCAHPHYDNHSFISGGLKLFHFNQVNAHAVLYEAHGPSEIFYSVVVEDWVPKTWLFPIVLPNLWQQFWSYTLSLNLALALFNAVPFYLLLDGKVILETALTVLEEWLLSSNKRYSLPYRLFAYTKPALHKCLMFSGTFLLSANIVLAYVRALN